MRQLRNVPNIGLLLFLFSGLAVIPALGAANPDNGLANWDNVKQLPAGRSILIVQKDAKSFQGKLQSVSDENLVIRLTTGEQAFAKGVVLRVSSRGASHRWRNAALGAAIGSGGGAGAGAAAGNPNALYGRGVTAAVGGVIGLAAGAAVGAALPSGGWREVYRAQ